MDYLLKVNRTFYVRVVVPKDLLPYFPSKVIKRSLRTTSKTHARHLLPVVLCDIQKTFYQIRLRISYMDLKQPSQRAIEIFKKRYGQNVSVYEAAQLGEPCIQGTGWKFKTEIFRIQAKLDAGYLTDEDNYFNLEEAPERGLTTSPQEPIVQVNAPVTTPQESELTLAEASDLYIQHCINPTKKYTSNPRAASTLESEKQALKQLKAFMKSDKVLLSELPNDFYDFSAYLRDTQKLAYNSVNTRLNCLSRFFKFLKDSNHIKYMPAIKFQKPQGIDKVDNSNLPYTNEMLNKLFTYLITNKPTSIKARKKSLSLTYLLLGLLHTGFRITEFTKACKIIRHNNIPVFDIDTLTKGVESSIRYVPVHEKLFDVNFIEYFEKYKFPSNPGKDLRDILNTLGIKKQCNDYTLHSCRSSFDTRLHGKIEDGLRKRLMGHTLGGMDKKYVKQLPDDVKLYCKAVDECLYDIDYPRIRKYVLSETKDLYV